MKTQGTRKEHARRPYVLRACSKKTQLAKKSVDLSTKWLRARYVLATSSKKRSEHARRPYVLRACSLRLPKKGGRRARTC